MADPVIQNAIQLRNLADHAASLRGAPWSVYAQEAGGRAFVAVDPEAVRSGFLPTPIMELDTRFQHPGRPVPEVVVRAEGGEMSLADYDAVFWSEASVEKFVFPYYASKSLWLAAHVLTVLSKFWYGFVPGVERTPEPPVVRVDGEEAVPFAVAHLPTSDYVMLSDGGAGEEGPGGVGLGSELHLLFRRKRDGKIVPKPLAEFLRAEAGAGDQNG